MAAFGIGAEGKDASGIIQCCSGGTNPPNPGGCQATINAKITPGATLSPGTWTYGNGTATAVFSAPSGSNQVGSITITATGPNDGGLYPSRCVTISPPCDDDQHTGTTVDLTQSDLSDCYLYDSNCTDQGCAAGPGPDNRGLVPKTIVATFKSYLIGLGGNTPPPQPVNYPLFGPNEGNPITLNYGGQTSDGSGIYYDSGSLDGSGEWHVSPPGATTISQRTFEGSTRFTPSNMPPASNGTKVPYSAVEVTLASSSLSYKRTGSSGGAFDTFSGFSMSFCAPFYYEGGYALNNGSYGLIFGGAGTINNFLNGGSNREMLTSFTLQDGCAGGSYSGNTDSSQSPQPMMATYRGAALPPSPSLRVGLVCPWLLMGGAEAWQLSLVDALSALLGPLVSWQGAACVNQPTEPAMVADLAALMPVTFGWDAARSLAAQCDVVVTWHVADYAALYQGLPTPPRTLFVCHLPTAWGSGSTAMLASVDSLVAVSELAQTPIPAPLKVRSGVIWNAVDTGRLVPERNRATVRAAWGVPAAAKVVGFLGRLSDEKNPDAALVLAQAAPELTVVVVGSGPLGTALAAGAPANLKLVGADHDKAGVIGACDLILVPSDYESFGLVIAEAAWLGVPVVSTPVGLAAIHAGLTRVVPLGADGPTIATAVRADLADPVGTGKRVAAAQAWVQSTLTLDRLGRQYATALAALAPAVVAGKITAVLTGQIARSALAPNLDLAARVATCPHSPICFCVGVDVRPCDHPGRPAQVDRDTCRRCQAGEFDQ